jgi:MerR family transcriptional regulator/heat shock protein HspR
VVRDGRGDGASDAGAAGAGTRPGLGRLDDQDYPVATMGQAADLLAVQPAFLRSLDAAGVLEPHRSGGGHRRYSRRQLAVAERMRVLFDEGMTLDAASRIVQLQDQLAAAAARIEELERELAQRADDAGS